MHKKNTLQQKTHKKLNKHTRKSVATGTLMLANILINPQQITATTSTPK
jgi:hypothetical protein